MGYITLEPCTPITRDIIISHTSGSKVITCSGVDGNEFLPFMKGQYIYFDGGWSNIVKTNSSTSAEVDLNATLTGTSAATVATMNHITVSGTGVTLTKFDISYVARL